MQESIVKAPRSALLMTREGMVHIMLKHAVLLYTCKRSGGGQHRNRRQTEPLTERRDFHHIPSPVSPLREELLSRVLAENVDGEIAYVYHCPPSSHATFVVRGKGKGRV